MSELGFAAAISFAFGAGVTTFFAPCAYPLLPGYVGYYLRSVDDDGSPVWGALLRGLAASVGIGGTFGVLAVLTVSLGEPLAGHLTALELLVGLVLVGLGVMTLSGRTTAWHASLPQRRLSIVGFLAFGVLYAVAATGCLAPVFVGVVSQALTFPVYGRVSIVGAYAAGMAMLMIGVTVAVAVGVDVGRDWIPGASRRLTQVAGAILILAGFAQVWLVAFGYV